jgi:Bor protein
MRYIRMLTLLLIASSIACYKTRLIFQKSTAVATNKCFDHRWYHGGIFGLLEFSDPVPLSQLCEAGVAYIDEETTFLNGLVQQLTRGLYTPQTVTVYCANGRVGEAALNANGKVVVYLLVTNSCS